MTGPTPRGRSRRWALGTALFAVAFGTNVSTPLLLRYQESLGLDTWTTTALFAIYPLGLLPTLIWAGPASDAYGRRAVMTPGLALSAVASAVMIVGQERLEFLFAGRLLLGAVSGLVFVTASAWMQEVDRDTMTDALWPSRLTGMLLYAGFGCGPLVAGIIGQWGPAPLTTPYLVHIALVCVGLVTLRLVPETVSDAPGGWVRPQLGVAPSVRGVFVSVVVPTALAVFGFASLGMGLFPVVLRPEMRGIAVFASGLVASLVAGAIFATQRVVPRIGVGRSAPLALALGSLGCLLGLAAFGVDGAWLLVFPASICLGAASGLAVTSGLRMVDLLTAPATRGAMTGTFYAVAYAAMTMPALVAAVARSTTGYCVVLGVMAAAAAAAAAWLRRAAPRITATA
jgi:MFS family permease